MYNEISKLHGASRGFSVTSSFLLNCYIITRQRQLGNQRSELQVVTRALDNSAISVPHHGIAAFRFAPVVILIHRRHARRWHLTSDISARLRLFTVWCPVWRKARDESWRDVRRASPLFGPTTTRPLSLITGHYSTGRITVSSVVGCEIHMALCWRDETVLFLIRSSVTFTQLTTERRDIVNPRRSSANSYWNRPLSRIEVEKLLFFLLWVSIAVIILACFIVFSLLLQLF